MKHINFITWNFCKHLCIITANIRVQTTQVIILCSHLTIGMVVTCKALIGQCVTVWSFYIPVQIFLSYYTPRWILSGICFQSFCRPCDHVNKVVLGNNDVISSQFWICHKCLIWLSTTSLPAWKGLERDDRDYLSESQRPLHNSYRPQTVLWRRSIKWIKDIIFHSDH